MVVPTRYRTRKPNIHSELVELWPMNHKNQRQSPNRWRTRRRQWLIRPLIALQHSKQHYVIRLRNYARLLRLYLIVSIFLLQMTLRMGKVMPRQKAMPEIADQDLILPETTEEPTIKTKRGRPKGNIGTSARSGSSKLDKEIKAIEKSLSEIITFSTILSVPASFLHPKLGEDVTIAADRALTFMVPALGDLARENARFRLAMLSIGTNQVYLNLITAVIAMLVPIAVNHYPQLAKADLPFQAMARLKNATFADENNVPNVEELLAVLGMSNANGVDSNP